MTSKENPNSTTNLQRDDTCPPQSQSSNGTSYNASPKSPKSSQNATRAKKINTKITRDLGDNPSEKLSVSDISVVCTIQNRDTVNDNRNATTQAGRTKSRMKVWEWLDQMPSSPENPLSDNDSERNLKSKSLPNKNAALNPDIKPEINVMMDEEEEHLKTLLLSKNFSGYTSPVTKIKTREERDSILKFAESKIPELTEKIVSQPGHEPYSYITGTVFVEEDSFDIKKNKEPPITNSNSSNWLHIPNIFGWLGKLPVVQWLFKTKTTTPESSNVQHHQDVKEDNKIQSRSVNQKLIKSRNNMLIPYYGFKTKKGEELTTEDVLQARNIKEDVKLALRQISFKLKKIPPFIAEDTKKVVSANELGISPAEPPPQETMSMQEIKQLTELLTTRLKKNNVKMRTIFGFRQTRPCPDNYRRENNQRSTQQMPRVSLWQRFSMLFNTSQQQRHHNRHRRGHRRRRSQSRNLPPLLPLIPQNILNENHVQDNAVPIPPQQTSSRHFLRNIASQVGNGLLRLFGLRRDDRVYPQQHLNQEENQAVVPFTVNRGEIRQNRSLLILQQTRGGFISRTRNPLRHRTQFLETLQEEPV